MCANCACSILVHNGWPKIKRLLKQGAVKNKKEFYSRIDNFKLLWGKDNHFELKKKFLNEIPKGKPQQILFFYRRRKSLCLNLTFDEMTLHFAF
jgi:hypothetical protein